MTEKREFKGVWIPRNLWLDSNIGWTEKLLLTEIDSLCQNGTCFASNQHFANFFGLSKDRISKTISSLVEKEYVEVEIRYTPGTKMVDKRIITTIGYRRKQLYPIGENTYTPIGENAEDNNTVVNNTLNNTKILNNVHTEASPPEFDIPDFELEGLFTLTPLHENKSVVAGSKKDLETGWKIGKFENFWERFKKKKAAAKVKTKWLTLTREEIEKILEVVDDHVLIFSVREFQFRPHPITWLNQRCWEDDISEELRKLKPRNYPKRTTTDDDQW